ncbi:Uncharacterised protein [uncultured archaeon]|nr:Uncharacterised protein [uncultured archaeon]
MKRIDFSIDSGTEMLKKNYLQKQNLIYLFTILISFILLYQNRFWLRFVDESDNLAVGWLISKGYVLYKDVFSHHMPFPYYYSSFLISLGLKDFVSLRFGMSLTILFFWVLIIVIFKNKINYKILCVLILLSALAHPIFWGQMFLADSFFGYSFLIVFLYFFSNPQLNFNITDEIIIAIMIFISIMSTPVSIYPILLLGIYYILTRLIQLSADRTNYKISIELKFAIIIFLPFLIVFVLIYFGGYLQQFLKDVYFFNSVYYSQFADGFTGMQLVQPIKDYIGLIFAYITNINWLFGEKSFVWKSWDKIPLFFEGFLVISNLLVSGIFWNKRNRYLAIFYFLILGYLRMRNVWFHAVPYYLLSFFGVSLLITEAYDLLLHRWVNPHNLMTKAKIEIFLIVFYGLLALVFMGVISIAYISNGSGTGEHYVYSSPYNNIIQTLTQPNDTIWVAPLDPMLYFSNNRLPASQYIFYLPWLAASNEINTGLIEDLELKKPPLIIFNRDDDIWGYVLKDYGKTIDEYLHKNYYQVDADNPIYKNVYLITANKNRLLNILIQRDLYQPLDINQQDISSHIGEIISGEQVIQTFTPLKPGTYRMDIMLATFARENHGKVIFHLKQNLTGDDFYNKTENISMIKNNDWYPLYFPPFDESKIDKRIYLVIEAPESKTGDAITIYSSKDDKYKFGELYINGQPTGKDLTFRTYWKPKFDFYNS